MIFIRHATPDDRTALALLGERLFRDAYSHDNAPEDMDAYVAASFTEAAFAAELADPRIRYLVATLAPAGARQPEPPFVAYAKLSSGEVPGCVATPAPLELSRFYVSRELHGSGAARALMDRVLAEARALGGRSLWLGVWERNPRARAFYAKVGFRDVGTHEFLLGSDLQIDRVLARDL